MTVLSPIKNRDSIVQGEIPESLIEDDGTQLGSTVNDAIRSGRGTPQVKDLEMLDKLMKMKHEFLNVIDQ